MVSVHVGWYVEVNDFCTIKCEYTEHEYMPRSATAPKYTSRKLQDPFHNHKNHTSQKEEEKKKVKTRI